MTTMRDLMKNYAAAVMLGAVGGGLLVALTTRALPRMMTQIMSGMMQTMMSNMSESGCDPSQM